MHVKKMLLLYRTILSHRPIFIFGNSFVELVKHRIQNVTYLLFLLIDLVLFRHVFVVLVVGILGGDLQPPPLFVLLICGLKYTSYKEKHFKIWVNTYFKCFTKPHQQREEGVRVGGSWWLGEVLDALSERILCEFRLDTQLLQLLLGVGQEIPDDQGLAAPASDLCLFSHRLHTFF